MTERSSAALVFAAGYIVLAATMSPPYFLTMDGTAARAVALLGALTFLALALRTRSHPWRRIAFVIVGTTPALRAASLIVLSAGPRSFEDRIYGGTTNALLLLALALLLGVLDGASWRYSASH